MSHDRAGLRTVHYMHWRNALSTTGRTCERRDLTRAGGTGFVLNANPCCDAVRGSDDSPRKTSLVDARIDAANPGYCLSSAASITCFLILRLHRACGLPASIDTCAVGKRRAITHRHGLSLPTNDDSTNDSFAPDPDRFFALAAIGYESFLAYRCVNRFWCIWGFWAGAGSLADRRPTGREA